MNGKELLNAAFGDIDIRLIAAVEEPPRRRITALKWVAVIAACVAIVIAMIPFILRLSMGDSPIDPSTDGHVHLPKLVRELPPTCEDYGERYFSCQKPDCDYGYSEKFGEPLGHIMEPVECVEPTCEKSGYTVYKCARDGCDRTELREPIEAKGHGEFVTVTVPSGCLSIGYTAERCGFCDFVINKRDIQPALLHDFYGEGEQYTCNICGVLIRKNEMPPTYAELIAAVTNAGDVLKTYGNFDSLPVGRVAEESALSLDSGRFTVILRAMGELPEHSSDSEILNNDGVDGVNNYLRITQSKHSTGSYIIAETNGERDKAMCIEFSLRLGSALPNGGYIAWSGAWESPSADGSSQGIMALSQNESGVLSFGNSDFAIQLSEKRFTRVKLVYRFSLNRYDIYIDGILCCSEIPITEDGMEALAGFIPARFWYAVTEKSSVVSDRYFDLGSFVAYVEE